MEFVRRPFVTPFDRSDIQELIQATDDSIDQMNQTTKAIALFEVRAFDSLTRGMAGLAVEAAQLTAKATPLLRDTARHAAEFRANVAAVKDLEARSDAKHDEGLRQRDREGNTTALITGSEI